MYTGTETKANKKRNSCCKAFTFQMLDTQTLSPEGVVQQPPPPPEYVLRQLPDLGSKDQIA